MTVTDKEIIDTIETLNTVWGVSRSGLIISLSGARVGTWTWNKARLLVSPQNDQFKKDFRQLTANGILIKEPVKGDKNLDVETDSTTSMPSTLRVLPVSQAAPGELDFALKAIGYFMIETDLPPTK